MTSASRTPQLAPRALTLAPDESGQALRFAGVLALLAFFAGFRRAQLGEGAMAAVATAAGVAVIALGVWSRRGGGRRALGLGMPLVMTAAALALFALSGGQSLGAAALLGTAPAVAVLWGSAHGSWAFLAFSLASALAVGLLGEDQASAGSASWPLAARSGFVAAPLALALFFLARSSAIAREVWQLDALAAQSVLAANAARLQAYLENAHDVIAELDGAGRVLFVTAKQEDRYALPIADLLGSDGGSYLHPDDHGAGLRCFRAAARGHANVSAPMRYRGSGDGWRWLRVAVSSYRTAAGELRFVVQARDETELQEMQAERERAVSELEAAFARIETLRGRIAICASCKQVKNESEVWEPIDEFVARRSLAEFSHGLCPRCLEDKGAGPHAPAPGEGTRT